VVIEVLVAERQAVNALAQKIELRVRDEVRIARIGDPRVERADQAPPTIGRPQHPHPAIAGDLAPGKTRLDFAAIEAWKREKFGVPFWH